MCDSSLKIIHIHSTDGGGGGGLIAYYLMNELNTQEYTSNLYVGNRKFSKDPRVKYISKKYQLANKILNHLSIPRKYHTIVLLFVISLTSPKILTALLTGKEYRDTYNTEKDLEKILKSKHDLIHLHNLHPYYFDLSALITLSQKMPVVITLHDAWLLTGHCAHFFDCMKWKTGCGNCPNLAVYPPTLNDTTSYNWEKRKRIYQQCKLYVTAPSEWVLNCAHESILNNGIQKSRVIPNGINLDIFHPGDKVAARKQLNLPENKFIIIFAASGLKSGQFKDHTTLLKTLGYLGSVNADIYCIALGDSGDPKYFGNSVEIHYVPFVSDPVVVSTYYRAADVYVHPARAETFGLVIVEAEACGLPVIASDVGGIPELILEGKTGYLIPVGNAEVMAQRILELKDNTSLRKQMSENAASLAKERYDEKLMIQRYIEFYQGCITDAKGN